MRFVAMLKFDESLPAGPPPPTPSRRAEYAAEGAATARWLIRAAAKRRGCLSLVDGSIRVFAHCRSPRPRSWSAKYAVLEVRSKADLSNCQSDSCRFTRITGPVGSAAARSASLWTRDLIECVTDQTHPGGYRGGSAPRVDEADRRAGPDGARRRVGEDLAQDALVVIDVPGVPDNPALG